MQDMELLVYKASAGSGKTFTLAVEYMRHLMLNPRAYRQILAVTFTNKATGEMKERILSQLCGIWLGVPQSEAYLNVVCQSLAERGERLEKSELRRRAGLALRLILHDYAHFRVETIDSFFQSVMRNLARELDLSPNLNIELNSVEVLDNAVDSMIGHLVPSSPVLKWILSYIEERIASDKRWNVADELKKFGRNIFDEGYVERSDRLRACLEHEPKAVALFRDLMYAMQQEALDHMKAFADRFDDLLQQASLSAADLKGGERSSIASYFRKLKRGDLTDKDVQNQTLSNCLQDSQAWVAQKAPKRATVLPLVESKLRPLLVQAEEQRPAESRTVNSTRLALQHLNKLQLLSSIDEEVRRLNYEQNRFLLSDTNILLQNLMRQGDSSFVFEKIGTEVGTLMIDEFQDTSRMQWDNFRLLLLEGLSQGYDSLIVGDVKQSIYRWRNGDWRILEALGQPDKETACLKGVPPSTVRIKTLTTNRRSEANVIAYNNHLFPAIVRYLNGKYRQEQGEDCLPLTNAYADVVQQTVQDETRGYVQAVFVEPDDEQNYQEKMLDALGKTVSDLLARGIRANDIAILVRKNKNIPLIADYLSHRHQLHVVSDEAFRLDASVAMSILINALRLLVNPDNGLARAALVLDYRQAVLADPRPVDLLLLLPPAEALPDGFADRQRLLEMPLYDLVEHLVSLFSLHTLPRQEGYLLAFLDQLNDFLQDSPATLEALLGYWDETMHANAIPNGESDGIHILSIHKAKGLEYHTVLLPFCDWKIENETNAQLVWCTPDEKPYDALGVVPVNYSQLMAQSVFQKDYAEEKLQLWVDNLNLLYVALTRARCNLFLWTRREQKGTMAELLAATLPGLADEGCGQYDAETGTYALGEPMPSADKKTGRQDAATEASNPLALPPRRMAAQMVSMPHKACFRQSNRSAEFIASSVGSASPTQFVDRGRLLHSLFATIATAADAGAAIGRYVADGIIDAPEADRLHRLTQEAFRQEPVRDWYSGDWQLMCERDIVWRADDGTLCNRRPDRVMLRGNELVVVDFKFGQPQRRYAAQVRSYMKLLARIGGYADKRISGYLWYVEQGTVERV